MNEEEIVKDVINFMLENYYVSERLDDIFISPTLNMVLHNYNSEKGNNE